MVQGLRSRRVQALRPEPLEQDAMEVFEERSVLQVRPGLGSRVKGAPGTTCRVGELLLCRVAGGVQGSRVSGREPGRLQPCLCARDRMGGWDAGASSSSSSLLSLQVLEGP